MMLGEEVKMEMGSVAVFTSENGGHSVEQLAEMCLNKLMVVSDNAPPEIRDQARAFREKMRSVLEFYFRQVVMCDRETIVHRLMQHGLKEYAEAIRNM